jgi:hypothetical protein
MAASSNLSEHFERVEVSRTACERFPPPDLDAPEESWDEWVNILLIAVSSNWRHVIKLMKKIAYVFLRKFSYEIALKIYQICEKFIMAEGKFDDKFFFKYPNLPDISPP